MDRLLGSLARRRAARRGIAGEHWAWLVVAAAAFLLRRSRRAEAPLVASMSLRAGERALVTLHPRYPDTTDDTTDATDDSARAGRRSR